MRSFHYLLLGLSSLVTLVQGLQYRGADFSSLINVENQGIRYKDNGTTLPFETILKNRGCNLARIRIWTSTRYNEYSLEHGLALAKRAAAAGMDIYVDLHYSDTCGCHLSMNGFVEPNALCRGRSRKAGNSFILAKGPRWVEHEDLRVHSRRRPRLPESRHSRQIYRGEALFLPYPSEFR